MVYIIELSQMVSIRQARILKSMYGGYKFVWLQTCSTCLVRMCEANLTFQRPAFPGLLQKNGQHK